MSDIHQPFFNFPQYRQIHGGVDPASMKRGGIARSLLATAP